MNIQHPSSRTWTSDEFLRWAKGREGKFELVDGRIVDMMIHVTRSHVRLATRLLVELSRRLKAATYDIGSADFGVRISDRSVRYPDVFVDRIEDGMGTDLTARAPVVLAEILSPSSVARDFGPKATEYTTLASLLHYVVLSPDEPRLWLWSRDDKEAFGEPVLIEGPEAVLELDGLGIVIPLVDLYPGLAPGEGM